jgi:transposase-like protein
MTAVENEGVGAVIGDLRVDRLPIREVAIEVLREGDSPRSSGRNTEHVELLAEVGSALPPIVVHRPSMRIIDGMHRVEAARRRGDRTIRARLFDGDEEVAYRLAVHANVTHGMPLTLVDRTTAAGRILRSRPNLSDRAVARTTGLSPGTVRALRRRDGPDAATGAGRLGRDGRVRPLNSADGRRLAAALISERPQASLREIAREAGISPATVRDVRQRVNRGDNPVPTGRRPPETPADRPAHRTDGPSSTMSCRTPTQLLHDLRRDPSLRFNEAGRALVGWLNGHAAGVERWSDLVHRVPPHCTYLLSDIARLCAAEWTTFAEELDRRRDAQTGSVPDGAVARSTAHLVG